MKVHFSAHGQYHISQEDNIIIVEAKGPWNYEFLVKVQTDLCAAVQALNTETYAILVIPHGESLVVDEAISFHEAYIRQGNAKAIAINLQYCTTPLSSRTMFGQVYGANGITHEFFEDNDTAKRWLLAKLV